MKVAAFKTIGKKSDLYEIQKFSKDDLKNSKELSNHFTNFFRKNIPTEFYSQDQISEYQEKRTPIFFRNIPDNIELFVIRNTLNGKVKGLLEIANHPKNKNNILASKINWIMLDKSLQGEKCELVYNDINENTPIKVSELLFSFAEKSVLARQEKEDEEVISSIVLNVIADNKRAISLYTNLGFQIQEGVKDNFTIMHKDL